jgi:hypothetical protein|tara:strand:+ start:624 stop:893 length:270 start_codon:yes stop_codon:yes gene_type:complete
MKTLKSRIEHYCELVLSRPTFAAATAKKHAKKHAESKKGFVLSETQIEEARSLAAGGWTNKRISEHFGVGMGLINKVCRGVKRGHADGR